MAKILSELGATVIDADQVSRVVTAQTGRAYQQVLDCFGPTIKDENGDIDRAKLRSMILPVPEKKKQLEEIVHPAIWLELERIVEQYFSTHEDPFVYEVTLIHESGNAGLFKSVWCTHVTREVQIKRLAARWGMDLEKAQAFVNLQKDNAWRASASDAVIATDGSFAEVAAQVEELWSKSFRS